MNNGNNQFNQNNSTNQNISPQANQESPVHSNQTALTNNETNQNGTRDNDQVQDNQNQINSGLDGRGFLIVNYNNNNYCIGPPLNYSIDWLDSRGFLLPIESSDVGFDTNYIISLNIVKCIYNFNFKLNYTTVYQLVDCVLNHLKQNGFTKIAFTYLIGFFYDNLKQCINLNQNEDKELLDYLAEMKERFIKMLDWNINDFKNAYSFIQQHIIHTLFMFNNYSSRINNSSFINKYKCIFFILSLIGILCYFQKEVICIQNAMFFIDSNLNIDRSKVFNNYLENDFGINSYIYGTVEIEDNNQQNDQLVVNNQQEQVQPEQLQEQINQARNEFNQFQLNQNQVEQSNSQMNENGRNGTTICLDVSVDKPNINSIINQQTTLQQNSLNNQNILNNQFNPIVISSDNERNVYESNLSEMQFTGFIQREGF